MRASAGAVRLTDGTPLMLSRSGYTGEIGFEIFIEPARLPKVWDMILQAGEAHGAKPCGLASRDSLRAGAVLPLSTRTSDGGLTFTTPGGSPSRTGPTARASPNRLSATRPARG